MLKIIDQVSYQKYLAYVTKYYQPLHTHLYTFSDDIFTPAFRSAAHKKNLLQFISEIHPQIYSWEMFNSTFCQQLIEEVRHFEEWCQGQDIEKRVPNSMNNYGVVLGDFGFYELIKQLMCEYIKPITAVLYPEIGGGTLDYHHSFIVEYAIGKDTSLDFHADASDITVNICLGNEFSGGDLYFGGIRCVLCQETTPLQHEEIGVRHEPGHVILHRGQHRHSAQDIKSGERLNMIMWCMSSDYQKTPISKCPSWCGNHGKR